MKDTNESSLQYQEFAKYVHHALRKKGFINTGSIDLAEIAIFMNYGIGEGKTENYSYSLPTFGQTGVSGATTYGTVNSYGGTATYSGTTTFTPTYGVTGSRTYSGSYTHFPRHLNLNAIDLIEYRDTQKEKEVWSTMIYSEGSSSDLRRVFPIMVAAAIPYLGENTGKRVLVEMQENSSELKEAFSDL